MTFKKFRRKNFFKAFNGKIPKLPGIEELAPVFEDFSQTDTELTDLTRKVGDAATAKRVQKLQLEYPQGTVPELVTMDWLKRGGWRYIYQAQLFGGRSSAGGLLPDFVVDTGGPEGMAWQIQGEYWHGRSKAKGISDGEAALRLKGQVIGGIKIGKVINLWESDLLTRRPLVFNMAMAGISLR